MLIHPELRKVIQVLKLVIATVEPVLDEIQRAEQERRLTNRKKRPVKKRRSA